MKRSRSLVLTLMAGTGLSLAGCDEAPPPEPPVDVAAADLSGDERLYRSVEDCIAGKVFTIEYCQTSYQAAQEAHAEVAPRYNDSATCEADFGSGACTRQTASDGTSWFMPFLAGYAVSSLIDDIGDGFKRRRHGGYHAKPLYYHPSGGYVTASGRTLGSTAAARWSPPPMAAARTASPPPTATTRTASPPPAAARQDKRDQSAATFGGDTSPSSRRYGSTSQTRTTLTGSGGFSGGGAFSSFGG